MKLSSFLLAVSLGGNAVLFGAVALRPSLVPPRFRDVFTFGGTKHGPAANPASAVTSAPAPRKLWKRLESENPSTLLARLRAAGFPPSVARDILRAEINTRYDARLRALTEPDPNTPFWKLPANGFGLSGARMEEYSKLQRERSKVLRELLAGLPGENDEGSAAQRRQFGSLPRSKIELVQRIEDDYAEMISATRAAANNIMLREDREKLALLAREKHADLAAVLSPAELEDYELRNSPITRLLSQQFGDFRPSAEEFRAIFNVQQQLNEKFPIDTGGRVDLGPRHAAQAEFNEKLKAALGEQRYGDFLRETSSEFQQLRRLAQRENVPAELAVQAFDLRNAVSKESLRVFNDPALTVEQKRSALTTLAQSTRSQLLSTLGPIVGPSFVSTVNNQWLNAVEHGAAVTFDAAASRTFGMDNILISLGSGPSFRNLPFAPPAPRP